jgi:hypothetical protein
MEKVFRTSITSRRMDIPTGCEINKIIDSSAEKFQVDKAGVT